MNDRFKFRAWDIKNEKMIYSDSEDNDEESGIFILDEDGLWIRSYFLIDTLIGGDIEEIDGYGKSEAIIMQCTGLKDTKGKLIYEGDIVRRNVCHSIENFSITIETGQVFFAEGAAAFAVKWLDKKHGCAYTQFSNIAWGSSTIIGNIYENPELMKEKGND